MVILSTLGIPIYQFFSSFLNNLSTYLIGLPWMKIHIGAEVLYFAFQFYLKYRQYVHVKKHKAKPKQLEGVVSDEEYEKARIYQIDNLKFSFIRDCIAESLEMALLTTYTFPKIWNLVNLKMPSSSQFVKSLSFTAIIKIMHTLTSMPFSLYDDFVIEAKHGFNNKTLRRFFTDIGLELFLNSCIVPPLIYLFLCITDYSGDYFVPVMFSGFQLLNILFMYLIPRVIIPLFYKMEPLKDDTLKSMIYEFAKDHKFPVGGIYQIDGSERSQHSNAFIIGMWGFKRIIFYDTILNQPHEQITSILAHEVGHWKHSHVLKQYFQNSALALIFLSLYHFIKNDRTLPSSFGYNKAISPLITMELFSKIISPFLFILTVLQKSLSRKFEYQADKFAYESPYGEHIIPALKEIHVKNKSFPFPDPIYVKFNYDHPTLLERIQMIESYKDKNEKKNQ